MTKPHFRFAVILAIGYLLALMLILFWPTPVDRPISGSLSTAIGWLHARGVPSFVGYNQIEFGANVLLFVPFGYILAALTKRWWFSLAAGLAASCLVELAQWLLLPHRFSSVLDIVANTAGTALGAGVFFLLHAVHLRGESTPEASEHLAAPIDPDPGPSNPAASRPERR